MAKAKLGKAGVHEYMRLNSDPSPDIKTTATDSTEFEDYTMFLSRGNDKLFVTGCKRSTVKLVIFIVLCVITFPLAPLTYFLLGFWAPKWKVLILHSKCCMRDAVLVLVEERRKFTATSLFRVKLDSENNMNYLVNKLQQFADFESCLLMFDYKLDRYVITESTIEQVNALGTGETFGTLKRLSDDTLADSGTNHGIQTLRQVYGRNILDVPLPPLLYFILTEVLTFFYIFQLFSCIVWYSNNYEVYATAIIVMSVISASSTTYLARSTLVKLRKAVLHECDVEVRRDGEDITLRSGDVVPGDVVKIPLTEMNLAFDGILLCGNVVVDEAMLTGESVPTLKNPLPSDRLDDQYWAEKNEVNTLFSGTKILQTRPPDSGDVYVIVTRTGFTTKKGETVKFMLHPKKVQKFKFYSEAYTYIKIMGVIGLMGFIYNIVDSIMSDYSFGQSFLNSLDLITIIIAPSLPLALSISVFYAIRRLRGKSIKCAIPNAINIAGKIKMVVFDKTGTLTEEGLTLHCVLSADSGVFGDEEVGNISCKTRPTLAACHALSVINDKICGDPIDVIGQQCSSFQFEDKSFDKTLFSNAVSAVNTDPQSKVQYGVVKIIPFESQLKRMSVVCEESGSGTIHVFCKGAPEQILQHCSPHSIPKDFSTQLNNYSSLGYRIIGLASKSLTQEPEQLDTTSRQFLESDLTFLGFLVLANRLKPETRSVVEELQRAQQRVVMCTGDNLLTAVCVGRDCSMIPDHADLYIVTAELEPPSKKASEEAADPDKCEGENLVVNYNKQNHTQLKGLQVYDDANRYTGPLRKIHLAMDGETFGLISKHKPELMDKITVTGTIFARFSPDEKMQLIEELQRRDYSVCMCGDGANDCEALQHANVGIALSKCEASLAAPFTSSNFNVSCVPVLLKEGQGALENSMSVFRFTAMYSIIQYLSVILLVKYDSILGDYQYLLEDLGVVLLFDFALGYTRPSPVLSSKRPRGSLLHPFILYSFIMQTGVCVAFILLAMFFVQQQSWYDPFDSARSEAMNAKALYAKYFETTVNFFQSSFQYIICALVFSIGHPHRRAVYTNLPMLLATVCSTGLLLLCLFIDPDKIPKMDLVSIPDIKFKFYILVFVACNFVLSLLVEYSFRVVKPLQSFLKFCRCKRGYKNRFKYIIEELNNVTADSDFPLF